MSTKEQTYNTTEHAPKSNNYDLQCISALTLCLIISISSITISYTGPAKTPLSPVIPIALMNLLFLTVSYILMVRSSRHTKNLEVAFLFSFVSIIVQTLPDGVSFICIPLCLIVAPIVLWVTNSYIYTLVSLVIELINIGLSFRIQITQILRDYPAESIAEMITYCLILGCFVIILLTGYASMEVNKGLTHASQTANYTGKANAYKNLIQENVLKSFIEETKGLINTLAGSIDLVSKSIEDGLGSKLIQIASLTSENIQRNLANLTDLNITANKPHEPEYVPTNLKGLFNRLWADISFLMRRNNLEGKLNVDKTFPESIQIDSQRVKQIVMNLSDYIMQRDNKSVVNIDVEHIDPFMDDNFCVEDDFYGNHDSPYLKGRDITDLGTDTTLRSFDSKEEISFSKKQVLIKNKNLKMIKVVIRNCELKQSAKYNEQILIEIEEGEIVNAPKSEMAKLNFTASKMICEQFGGKLQIQAGTNNELVFSAYIPFEIYAKNQIKVKGMFGLW